MYSINNRMPQQTKLKPREIIQDRESAFLSEIGTLDKSSTKMKPTYVADGGAGVVYRISESKVVKVMLGDNKYKKVTLYQATLDKLRHKTSQSPTSNLYEHFYLHSDFRFSKQKNEDGTPTFIYEIMEWMPTDLKGFSKENRWTAKEFIDIMCQVMHGIVLFNSLDYVLTDLKLDNVLFNPKTGRIKLIDFLESYDLKAKENKYMYTYYNSHNRHSFAEDVWRLGLLMLQFLLPRVLQYKGYDEYSEDHTLPSFIRKVRARVTKERMKYDYNEMIRPHLQDMYKTLVYKDPDKKKWQKLFPLLAAMLHNDPNKRPSVSNILRDRLFCRSCYLPRVDYSEDFANKYSGYEDSKFSEKEDVTSKLSENEQEISESKSQKEAENVPIDKHKNDLDQENRSDDPSEHMDDKESSIVDATTKQKRGKIPTKTKRKTNPKKRKRPVKKRLSVKKRKTVRNLVASSTVSSRAPSSSYSQSSGLTSDSDVADLTQRVDKKLKKSSTFKSGSTTNATLHVPSRTQKRSLIRPRIRRPRVKRSWKPVLRK